MTDTVGLLLEQRERCYEERNQLAAENERLQRLAVTLNKNADESYARAIDAQVKNKQLAARVRELEAALEAEEYSLQMYHHMHMHPRSRDAYEAYHEAEERAFQMRRAALGGQNSGEQEA